VLRYNVANLDNFNMSGVGSKSLLDLFTALFWKKFDEIAKSNDIRRIDGDEPMYLFRKDSMAFLIHGIRHSLEYLIWIESVNQDSFAEGFSAHVEVFYNYEEDTLSVKYHALMKDTVHYTWHWETTLKLLRFIGKVAEETVKEVYRIARRKI